MKKRIIAIITVIVMVLSFSASTVFAADACDRIMEAMHTFPFQPFHYVQAENILEEIKACGVTVTDEKADKIIAAMEECRYWGEKCNYEFCNLSEGEMDQMLVCLNKGASVLGCSIRYADDHDGIWEILVTLPDGRVIDALTFQRNAGGNGGNTNPVKHTDYSNVALYAGLAVLAGAAATAFVLSRKASADKA